MLHVENRMLPRIFLAKKKMIKAKLMMKSLMLTKKKMTTMMKTRMTMMINLRHAIQQQLQRWPNSGDRTMPCGKIYICITKIKNMLSTMISSRHFILNILVPLMPRWRISHSQFSRYFFFKAQCSRDVLFISKSHFTVIQFI